MVALDIAFEAPVEPTLDALRLDGNTQPRAAIDETVVAAYAEDMARGAVFPAIIVFFDGAEFWLADGFHRYWAAKGCDLDRIAMDIRLGTRRDAVLFSVGANADHGLRRTNGDKRRAVLTLLKDETWATWSDREIARICRVNHETVGRLRPPPPAPVNTGENASISRTFTHPKTGQPTSMNVTKIGQARGRGDAAATSPSSAQVAPVPTAALTDAPPTAEQLAAFKARAAEGAPIADAIYAIAEAFDRMPTPAEAARRFPVGLRHTFTDERAREIGGWFLALATAWQHENGAQHVAAE